MLEQLWSSLPTTIWSGLPVCKTPFPASRVHRSDDEGESEDGRIVLRRATAVVDFDDAVHGANAVGLDAAHEGVVVLVAVPMSSSGTGN